MAFRDFKIGTKQSIGFGIVLIVMAGVSIFAIDQMRDLRTEIDDINDIWLRRAVVISDLNLNAAALRINQLQHAFATDPARIKAHEDSMVMLVGEIIEVVEDYEQLKIDSGQRGLYSEAEASVYDHFEDTWEEYQDQTFDYISLYEARRNREAIELLTGEAGAVFFDFSRDLEQLVTLNEESAREASQRAGTTYTTTRNRITLLLVITILLSGVISAQLVRLITIPVRHLVNAARTVAEGDFNVDLESRSKDEIGTLTRSFNWMTQSLKTQQDDLQTKNLDLEEALHQLKDTQQQLILKEKMASLGQLTAGIAHEIKNPLNFVNNFAALSIELSEELSEELASNKEETVASVLGEVDELLGDLRFNAQKIHEHGQRADSIVRGMLEHSRGQARERRPLEINTLVEEYVNLAFHGMRASQTDFNATIERDYDEAVGMRDVVPQSIGQVLLNLLGNAFYAVHQRRLALDGTFAPRVWVSTRALADAVEIRVEDNGGGIPASILDRIFEPFFTTKPTGTGNTGLGLSLSYEIVTQEHGGTVSVESEEGEGSTFVVTLPG